MDPNANLKEQLMLASRLLYQCENDERNDSNDVGELAELVIALNDWIASGGFLPSSWYLGRTQ